MLKRLVLPALLLPVLCGVVRADPIPVDLELSLLIDVSGSVDNTEFDLQRGGYVNAFRNPQVVAAIQAAQSDGGLGRIAANVIYWSSSWEQKVAVDWTLITDAASADQFATALENTVRPFFGVTSISGGLDFAAPQFGGNNYDGKRKVIDVSGDGTNNDGRPVADARDDALGVVDAINGLPILNGDPFLEQHYQNFVTGGDGAFVLPAATFADFEDAIAKKLQAEILDVPPDQLPDPGPTNETPEPATMVLALMGGLALGGRFLARRRQAS